jgi:hypothetical protein
LAQISALSWLLCCGLPHETQRDGWCDELPQDAIHPFWRDAADAVRRAPQLPWRKSPLQK